MSFELRKETLDTLHDYYITTELSLNWSHVFTLPAWLKSWWEAFGAGSQPYLRSIWEGEALIGIAPLMVSKGTLKLIGSSDVCDYLDFIVRPGKENAFFQALLPSLRKEGFKKLSLEAQRPDAAYFRALAEGLVKSKSRAEFDFYRENESYELPLPETWEDYLGLLSKKQRHEVRRKLRRLERETSSYSYRLVEDYDAVQEFRPTFLELLQHNPEKAHFLTPQMERYFKALIDNMTQDGWARFGLLDINGVTAAAVLYFDYGGRIYLYNSGFLSDYRPLSAGLLSKVLLIKQAIEQDRQVYDFLKGREVYKSRLGGKAVPVYGVEVFLD